jgi:hypothetical protein
LISNHPSASGNQGSIWNYGSSKDNEFMGGEKGADAGGTVRYGGNGAYGEWAIDKDATNFYSTDTWNGPNGECNPNNQYLWVHRQAVSVCLGCSRERAGLCACAHVAPRSPTRLDTLESVKMLPYT